MKESGKSINLLFKLEIYYINNCAEDYGGAIYAEKVTLTNNPSYFIGNIAEDNQGGAIYTDKITNAVVYNAVFINNKAKANDDGGAIYINKENHITFSNCVFVNNSCGDEGGAIYLDSKSSTISLRNNIFSNNHAGDEGQAVFNKGRYGTINNNFWSDVIPSTSNDLLVEWKATIFRSNVHHIDTDPLHIELRLSKNNTDLNKVVRATLCYIKSDGSILPDGPNGNVSFIVPENINIKSQGITQNGTYIDFTSNKTGTFNITATLYGQSLTEKINFTHVLKEGE